jgi:site-specific DNA recombinase
MSSCHAAIYARVSSEHQAEGGTVASQIAALEARLAQDGLQVTPDHRFVDDGYSGSTLKRPALERLRDAVAAGLVDRLYVHSPDRLARRYAYQVLLIDEFRRSGVEVVLLNRPLGQSPEDDLLLQVQGMIAEYERAKILERSRRGKRHAAHAGSVSVLSAAPYGYRYVGRHAGGGVARYEVVEEQAAVVRRIFHWMGVDRLGIREICLRLERSRQPSPTGRPRWASSTLGDILKNPAYMGAAAFGKTRAGPAPDRLRPRRGEPEHPKVDGGTYNAPAQDWVTVPVPAIVDPALFEAVQAQLAENRLRHRRAPAGQRHLLQGLVVCKLCGYAYYGKTVYPRSHSGERREYPYYRCSGSDAYRFGGQRVCSNAQVRADHLNAAVWQEVERLLNDPHRLAAEYERRLDQVRDSGPEQIDLAALEAQVAKLKRGVDRLIDSYAEGVIDKGEFEPRLVGFRQRLGGLEERRRTLFDRTSLKTTLTLLVGRLEDFAGHVRNKLEAFDWHQRRDLIRLLVKRVEIDHTDITVVFRVTPLPDGHDPDNGSRILQDCPGRQHFPAVPVHNRHQVEKSLWHRDVRDISRPHLVLDGEAAQQVRIGLVLGVRLAGVGFLPDHLQAHLTHQPADPLAVDDMALAAQPILREP